MRSLLFGFCLLVFPATQLAGADSVGFQLTAEETLALSALSAERQQLIEEISALGPLWDASHSDIVSFATLNSQAILSFSDHFYDYKIARMAFHTRLAARTTFEAAKVWSTDDERIAALRALVVEFEETLSQIPKLSGHDTTSRPYKKLREGNASGFNSVNWTHRQIIDKCLGIANQLKDEKRSATARFFHNAKDKAKSLGLRAALRFISRWLKWNLPVLQPANLLLSSRLELSGHTIRDALSSEWANRVVPPRK